MDTVNRRNAVKLAAGLAVGTGLGAACNAAAADDLFCAVRATTDAKDSALATTGSGLGAYMFGEAKTIQLQGDKHSRDLVITSAKDEDGRETLVYVRSGTMRIFRANARKDEFTNEGGVYWKFNGKEGSVQLKRPGALVAVVREHDDTVRFYTLELDLRC